VNRYPIYLEGYWQSEDYFDRNKNEIRDSLKYPSKLDPKNELAREDLYSKNTISVHIRRGDYVMNPVYLKRYGICSLQYYKEAIQYMTDKVSHPKICVFTDDPEWVKDNLVLPASYSLVDWNRGPDSWKDLVLMTSCKYHIIANSTFSWWGAWLGETEDSIIIAPKQWYADNELNELKKNIVPERWIRL